MPASPPDPALTPPAADDSTPLPADSASPPATETPDERDELTLDERNRDVRVEKQDPHEPESRASEDRSRIISDGFASFARWSLRISIIIVTFYLVWRALTPFWVIILPLILGLFITTVLWPPAAWLRRHGVRPALAALSSVLGGLLVVGGIIAAIVPTVAAEAPELARKSMEGVSQIQHWLQGPPLKIPATQIDNAVNVINDKLKTSGDAIASGVFSGVTTVGSILVTLVLSLILAFFFIKDGDRFLPWVRLVTGERTGAHVTEVFTRAWQTLSGFIRTQAIVSAIDSVCIGIGLIACGVPLALPLCVITFFGGFIPIVGATVAGALAVLVALVTKGVTTAIIVLVIIILVQQLEGHILQPLLQSRSMSLHPVLVLLGIAAGSEDHGVIGGFLAVPVVATLAVLFRYIGEQVDLRSGTVTVADLEYRTDRGRIAALRTERLRRLGEWGARETDEEKASREAVADGDGDALAASTTKQPTHGLGAVVSALRSRLKR
ncbi:membrane protein [Dermacoccus nishinomiyaensis]|uniref:Membrane protein n=1 Tax=Dermacoccus nishinomiyaensis TaxID=1274 RepID=A0A075JDE7_9MICO|nr:AI-2E family transporter [Dermacoccus nishinomiyaensis]AIF40326.1 membrane protein [Dermacoccus nishinomiyaensis]